MYVTTIAGYYFPASKYLLAISDESICATLMISCCNQNCVQSKFTMLDIKRFREIYHSQNELAKSNWLLEQFHKYIDKNNNNYNIVLNGKTICRRAFVHLYGISNGKFYSVLKKFKGGVEEIIHGNTFFQHSAKKQDICFSWLTMFKATFADTSPVNPDVAYLPMQVVHIELYEEMMAHFLHTGVEKKDYPSLMTFLLVWRRDFPNLKTSRKIHLGRCSFCTVVNTLLSKSLTEPERQKHKVEKFNHIREVFKMRNNYDCRISLAKTHPQLYTSWAVDYIDPPKIPHPTTFPSSWLTKQRIKLEMCGFIDHGADLQTIFYHTEHFSHSANLLCSIFFLKIKKAAMDGKLARNLYLQADNCAKETHNQIFFIFLAFLVQTGVFDSIELSSLPPGHTHFDVDRDLFAKIKTTLKTCTIESVAAFSDVFLPKLNSRRTKKVQAILLTHLYDWESFFQNSFRAITGHQKVHQFRWCIPAGGKVANFFYRKVVDEGNWIGVVEGTGFQPFITVPRGIPDPIGPTEIPHEKLGDMPFFFRWLSPQSQSWWKNFSDNQFFFYPKLEQEEMETFWPVTSEILVQPISETIDEEDVEIQMTAHPIVTVRQLKVDDLILIKDPDCSECGRNFRVARIVKVNNRSCDVVFYICGRNGRYQPTDEKIEVVTSEILCPVVLTTGSKIHASTLQKLARQFKLVYTS